MPEVTKEILEKEIRRLEEANREMLRRLDMLEGFIKIIPALMSVLEETLQNYLKPIRITEMSILD